MRMNILPSRDFLSSILSYDAALGRLKWKARSPETFGKSASRSRGGLEAVCRRFNSHHAGGPAFAHKNGSGYLEGKINGVRFSAHRVIWKLVHDIEPEIIDHINGDRTDNRIENLRSVTALENARNLRSSSTGNPRAGIRRTGRRWSVTVGAMSLGSYGTLPEAVECREAAETELAANSNKVAGTFTPIGDAAKAVIQKLARQREDDRR